jgi:hypothetical protein
MRARGALRLGVLIMQEYGRARPVPPWSTTCVIEELQVSKKLTLSLLADPVPLEMTQGSGHCG